MNPQQLSQFRFELKKIGYKARIQHYSEFSIVRVFHAATNSAINDGNAFSPEYVAKHKAAFDLINSQKSMIIKD